MFTKLISLLLLCLTASNIYAQDREKAIRTTFHSISSNDMMNDAAELTSLKYGGRLSGSPGYLAAAQWLASELKKAGVKPGLNDSTYLQYFPNAYSDVLSPGSVTLLAGKNNAGKEYRFPDDYFPGSNSAPGSVSGEVVYVGFGISAPELGYDDYRNIDVRIFSGLPVRIGSIKDHAINGRAEACKLIDERRNKLRPQDFNKILLGRHH